MKTSVIYVPHVSKSKMARLMKKIRPMMYFSGQGRCYIKLPETLSAQPYFPLEYWRDPQPENRAIGLRELCAVKTYHIYGCDRKFKPLISEVLAQIPRKFIKESVAFQIVQTPDEPHNLREEKAYKAGYHIAWIKLFRKR